MLHEVFLIDLRTLLLYVLYLHIMCKYSLLISLRILLDLFYCGLPTLIIHVMNNPPLFSIQLKKRQSQVLEDQGEQYMYVPSSKSSFKSLQKFVYCTMLLRILLIIILK